MSFALFLAPLRLANRNFTIVFYYTKNMLMELSLSTCPVQSVFPLLCNYLFIICHTN